MIDLCASLSLDTANNDPDRYIGADLSPGTFLPEQAFPQFVRQLVRNGREGLVHVSSPFSTASKVNENCDLPGERNCCFFPIAFHLQNLNFLL